MKLLNYLLILLVFFSITYRVVNTQEGSNPSYDYSSEEEAELFWHTDYDEAIAEVHETGKVLLIDFSGSDWCGYCQRLDREVFDTEEFYEYATENLVLLFIDFPKFETLPDTQLEHNREMQEEYEVTGYPTIFLCDEAGEPFFKTGYKQGGADKYIRHLEVGMGNESFISMEMIYIFLSIIGAGFLIKKYLL